MVVGRGPWGILMAWRHGRRGTLRALRTLWTARGKVLWVRLHHGPLGSYRGVLVACLIAWLPIWGSRGPTGWHVAELCGVAMRPRGRACCHVWGPTRGIPRCMHVAVATITLSTARVGGHHNAPRST